MWTTKNGEKGSLGSVYITFLSLSFCIIIFTNEVEEVDAVDEVEVLVVKAKTGVLVCALTVVVPTYNHRIQIVSILQTCLPTSLRLPSIVSLTIFVTTTVFPAALVFDVVTSGPATLHTFVCHCLFSIIFCF